MDRRQFLKTLLAASIATILPPFSRAEENEGPTIIEGRGYVKAIFYNRSVILNEGWMCILEEKK